MTLAEAPIITRRRPRVEIPPPAPAEMIMPGGSRSEVFEIMSDTRLKIDPKDAGGAVFAVDPEGKMHHRFADPDSAGGENDPNKPLLMGKGWRFVLFSKLDYPESVFNFVETGNEGLKTDLLDQKASAPDGLSRWIKEFDKITNITNPDPNLQVPRVINPLAPAAVLV